MLCFERSICTISMEFHFCRCRDPFGNLSPIVRFLFCPCRRVTTFQWQLFRWNLLWCRGNRPSRRSIWRISNGEISLEIMKLFFFLLLFDFQSANKLCSNILNFVVTHTCNFGSFVSKLGLVLAAANSAGKTLASPLQTFTWSATLVFCSSVSAWKCISQNVRAH